MDCRVAFLFSHRRADSPAEFLLPNFMPEKRREGAALLAL
jgi:hypothetical protein